MTSISVPAVPAKLVWPPPTIPFDGERLNLFDLIPPNSYDDYSTPNHESEVAGVTVRADRVILSQERYPDCERSTQHKLSDDIQASSREQGHWVSVKEWADKNQHRGTLRLRLRCRSSTCRFQFQLNWDSKMGVWFISRRRCGTFTHTCQPASSPAGIQGSAKRKLHDENGSGSKRVRVSPETINTKIVDRNSASKRMHKQTTLGEIRAERDKGVSQGNGSNEKFLEQALDSARSLLDLSRAASTSKDANESPVDASSQEKDESPVSPPSASDSTAAAAPLPAIAECLIPVQIGNRIFYSRLNPTFLSHAHGPILQGSAGITLTSATTGLAANQKIAIVRENPGGPATITEVTSGINSLSPELQAVLQGQGCIVFPYASLNNQGHNTQTIIQMDPRYLRQNVLVNGGVVSL